MASVMVTIGAAYAGLKEALGIVQGLNATNTQVQINDAKIPLQEHILNAQMALTTANETQAAAAERIRSFEQEIVRLKDWSGEKENYELKALGRGAFAYMLKPAVRGAEPAHWLCTRCYGDGKKSIMQGQGTAKERRDMVHGCPLCKATLTVRHWTVPQYDAEPED